MPSYPDRGRIDSDVRAFLRPASTPWIVFDRDSRASGLAAGDLLPGRSSVVLSDGAFPKGEPGEVVPAPEPSNVVVATDLACADPVDEAAPVAMVAKARRTRGWAIAASVAIAVFVAGASTFLRGSEAPADAASAAAKATPVVGDVIPPDLVLPKVASPAPRSASELAVTSGQGRLTLRGALARRNVYLDGKLVRGKGVKGALVACGTHTLTVGSKGGKARQVEVPCDGRLVLSR
jgi:hypothetical protein